MWKVAYFFSRMLFLYIPRASFMILQWKFLGDILCGQGFLRYLFLLFFNSFLLPLSLCWLMVHLLVFSLLLGNQARGLYVPNLFKIFWCVIQDAGWKLRAIQRSEIQQTMFHGSHLMFIDDLTIFVVVSSRMLAESKCLQSSCPWFGQEINMEKS